MAKPAAGTTPAAGAPAAASKTNGMKLTIWGWQSFTPEGDKALNQRQAARLKRLSDHLHASKRKYMFELLVPPEPAQLQKVGGDKKAFDLQLRPGLMVGAIHALQEAGVEPDVLKIEGVDNPADCERIAAEAHASGRDGVSCVVLGRGADSAQVDSWLRAGAGVPGYVGFAIGRSIFWDAVKGWLDTSQDRGTAARLIADNYRRFIDVYEAAAP